MLKKLLNGQINSIGVAAVMVAASSLLSRLLGIFRDRILASEFGAGDTLDVYYAAFRIPDLIFNLLVLGALSAGFIPIFTGLVKSFTSRVRSLFSEQENREAWELTSNVLNILSLFLIILAGLGFIFSPVLTKLISPGFSADKQSLTAVLTKIMFLSPIFLGISSVIGGVLQSFKRFFVYSLAPIFYNVGIIIGALYFVPLWGIYGLAWGVVLGAFLHMIVQAPALFGLGFKYKFTFDFKNKNLRKIGKMMLPRTFSLAIAQINILVITIIASTLASGSLSIFNFANNLQIFPVGIFGISFATAIFPTLSLYAFDKEKLVRSFSYALRQILFFIVPATVLILTLRAQIIRVILGAGQFDWEDTILTFRTLGLFSISLFAQAIIPLLVRVYYARHNSKTPFYLGIISVFLNIFLACYFAPSMGVEGLALAFSISSIVNFILLWLALHSEIGELDEGKILGSIIKFSIAAIVCGLAVQGGKFFLAAYVNMEKTAGIFAQGAVSAILGIIFYTGVLFILRSEELFNFISGLKRRLAWKKIETEDRGEARGI
jgi:putative peptidoglycan lipid II flippase